MTFGYHSKGRDCFIEFAQSDAIGIGFVATGKFQNFDTINPMFCFFVFGNNPYRIPFARRIHLFCPCNHRQHIIERSAKVIVNSRILWPLVIKDLSLHYEVAAGFIFGIKVFDSAVTSRFDVIIDREIEIRILGGSNQIAPFATL